MVKPEALSLDMTKGAIAHFTTLCDTVRSMTAPLRRQNDMYCSGQNLNECIGADETLTKPRPLWEDDPHWPHGVRFVASQTKRRTWHDRETSRVKRDCGLSSRDLMSQTQTSP